MGMLIAFDSRRRQMLKRPEEAQDRLPQILAQLLAAGATDFTRVALDAWGNRSIEPDELLELCTTYATVAGLETV
ncbi:MAG: hypothetical protein ACOY94_25650 [Bacillota bacterium]